ncbi:unnamed protein product, partial [Ectocarpus sp. 8 AP-2014]
LESQQYRRSIAPRVECRQPFPSLKSRSRSSCHPPASRAVDPAIIPPRYLFACSAVPLLAQAKRDLEYIFHDAKNNTKYKQQKGPACRTQPNVCRVPCSWSTRHTCRY